MFYTAVISSPYFIQPAVPAVLFWAMHVKNRGEKQNKTKTETYSSHQQAESVT